MTSPPVRVLLIADDPADARTFQDMLASARGGAYAFDSVGRLAAGLERLAQNNTDIILLDVSLPDSQGTATLVSLRAVVPTVPIVVLAGNEDEWLALEAVRDQAQDYLVRGQWDSQMLARVIRSAIQTRRLQVEVGDLSLSDPLTGLHNRRGFFTLAEQYFKLARRTQHSLVLIYVDVDDLKRINDSFGRAEGDRALVQVAGVLRSHFRESDIMARMGGDEFAFVALGATDRNAEALAARLGEGLRTAATPNPPAYELSLSAGMAWFNPDQPMAVNELVSIAHAAMSDHQQRKRKS